MEYPPDFPPESRARVEAEKIRAGRDFDSAKQSVEWPREVEVLLRKYILRLLLTFSKEAQDRRLWPVDRMDKLSREFLRFATIDAYYEEGYDTRGGRLREMISNWGGAILLEVEREFEKTPEWKQYQDALLEVAEAQTATSGPQSSRAAAPTDGSGHRSAADKNYGSPERRSVSAPLSKYRSPLKRGILMQLTLNSRATDHDICRGLDADGGVELPMLIRRAVMIPNVCLRTIAAPPKIATPKTAVSTPNTQQESVDLRESSSVAPIRPGIPECLIRVCHRIKLAVGETAG